VSEPADALSRFPRDRTWLLPALHALQHRDRWLSASALEEAADHLRVPKSEVYGVATHYPEFRLTQPGRRVVRVSVRNPLPDGVYVEREIIWRASGGARSEIARIGGIGSLRGLHNAQNAACAAACALAIGVSTETLQNGLRSFPGLAHRMEQVGRRGSVLFVNDSKGTNADAAAHALSSFADIFWIAGGKPKLGGITGLSEYFPRIRKAYLIGEAAQEFAATLGSRVPHEISETLDAAVASAARDAEASGLSDPVVLLSPACASFDQYRNFEIRGARFRDLVTALPGVKPVV